MIQISLKDVIQLVPTLQELVKQNFKGSLSFKIGRLTRELDKELALLEEAREEIVKKYAKKDDEGNYIFLENGNVEINEPEKCNEELQSLLDTVIEVNADKIAVEAFDNIEITPLQANALDVIVE